MTTIRLKYAIPELGGALLTIEQLNLQLTRTIDIIDLFQR